MNNSTNTPAPTPQPKKPKGPIRTEAVIPITIIVLLLLIYMKLFFDGNLRRAIEWSVSYVHGAEVDVGSVNTSFLGGSFALSGLQITDKEMPSRNLIELGQIRFKFNWDALLRLKFVVDDAGIETIKVYSPRKFTGWVKPPEPPSASSEPSAIAKLQNNILEQTQSKFSGNILGDVAQLLGGKDEKEIIKNIQGDLKSEKFIQDLSDSLKVKEKEWKERIAHLPKKEEFEALSKRAQALKFDTKNPSQFAKDLKEVKEIAKEADTKIDELKSTGKSIGSDADNFNKQFHELDDVIKKDIQDVEDRLKIGKIDYADFSKDLFGRMFADKLVTVNKYAAIAKQYMPPKKDSSDKEEPIVPRRRGKGENIRFPRHGGYPLFWLKHASISSEPSAEGFSGRLKGKITDVSSDPTIVANPMLFSLDGDFPQQQIMGCKFLVTLDHRTANSKDSIDAQIGSYPLAEMILSDSSDAKLALQKANGATTFSAVLQDSKLVIESNSKFTQAQYDIVAQSKVLQEALTSILTNISVVTVDAKATGSWENLSLHIDSNLGKELAEGLQRFVKAKVDAMKQQVRAAIDSRIKGKKDKLDEDFKKVKGESDKVLKDKKDELDQAKSKVESQSKSKKSSTTDDLKQKGKDLLKKFKF